MPENKLKLALDWKKKLAEGSELIEAKEYKRALVLLEDALKIAEELTDGDDLRIADTLERIAFSYHRLGLTQEAEPRYRRAIELAKPRLFGRDTEQLATENLADLLCETERAAEGEAMREAIHTKYPGLDVPLVQTDVSTTYRAAPENDIMRNLNSLARVNPTLAIPLMKEAFGLIETVYGAESLEAVEALEMLGGRSEAGIEFLEKVLRIQQKTLGSSDSDEAAIAYSMRNLALSHTDKTLSRALLSKARATEKKLGIVNTLDMTMQMIRAKLPGASAAQEDMPLEEAEAILAAWAEKTPDVPPFVDLAITEEQRQSQIRSLMERSLAAAFEIEKDEEYPLNTICMLSFACTFHEKSGDIEAAKKMLEKEMEVIASHWGDGHAMMVDVYERYQSLGSKSESAT